MRVPFIYVYKICKDITIFYRRESVADGQRHLHLRRAVRNLRTDQPVTDRHLDGRIGPLGRGLLRLLLLPRLPDRPGGLHREQRAHEYVSQLGGERVNLCCGSGHG